MLLNLSEQSNEPLHSQIARQIRARILTGGLEPGAQLPSIRALALELRVSVITVQTAYDSLLKDGLIATRRTKGSVVADLTEAERRDAARRSLA